jgi:hypothetical protein
MVITFIMDHMLKHAPGGKFWNMNPQQLNEYVLLDKEKCDKCDRLQAMMLNDRDIVLS